MMKEPKAKIKFTYEDYKSLPESETKRYELLGGELVMVPSPSTSHQRISRRLEFILQAFVEERGLGEVYDAPLDVVLGEGEEREVVQPDILYISEGRSGIIAAEEIRGAPDLIIEIISPATAERDRTYKKTLYARHGVKEYWIVDPEAKMVEVYTLGERGFELIKAYKAEAEEVLSSPLLEGLEVALKEVFR
ncbi:TPA: Uma2 family endonuclease [Candidatus Bipolaricaulota bacterium]|nr:Uma2 family endonuclease [Candidatus Bipolaricaulota bacterium]